MRLGAVLIATLGLIGSAAAGEPRYLPPIGTAVTYRLMYTVDIGGQDLGLSAKFSALARFPKTSNTTSIVRELIKVGL